MAVVHGGETIIPAAQTGGAQNININIDAMGLETELTTLIETYLRDRLTSGLFRVVGVSEQISSTVWQTTLKLETFEA